MSINKSWRDSGVSVISMSKEHHWADLWRPASCMWRKVWCWLLYMAEQAEGAVHPEQTELKQKWSLMFKMLLDAPTEQKHQQCKKCSRAPAASFLKTVPLFFLVPFFSHNSVFLGPKWQGYYFSLLWISTGVKLVYVKLFKGTQSALKPLCHTLCCIFCFEICLLCAVTDDFLCDLPNSGKYTRRKDICRNFIVYY